MRKTRKHRPGERLGDRDDAAERGAVVSEVVDDDREARIGRRIVGEDDPFLA